MLMLRTCVLLIRCVQLLLERITFCRNRINALFTEPLYVKKEKAWPLFLMHLFYEEGQAKTHNSRQGCQVAPSNLEWNEAEIQEMGLLILTQTSCH